MKKLLDAALSLNYLRKIFGFEIFFEAIKCQLKFKILSSPKEFLLKNKKNVLVLSPHPDDDVFGCAGTLSKHLQLGDKVSVVYFCDGSGGSDVKLSRKGLSKIRQQETQKSARILGIKNLVFWNFPDGKLPANRTTIKLLQSLMHKNKPEIIYAPSFVDNHPDHQQTTRILYLALKNSQQNYSPLIVLYEIWSPLFLNRLINITDVLGIKKQAIKAHTSQLQSRKYDEAIVSLNHYRAEINGITGYAEAFFVCSTKIYLKLFALINV